MQRYYDLIDKETRLMCKDMSKYSLSDLDSKEISSLLTDYFTCEEVMKAISCIIRYILQKTRISSDDYSLDSKIQEWFTNIKFFAQGESGIALSSHIVYSDDIIVIKGSKVENNSLFYEYLIGMILNKLRNKTPCFSYTYGIFNCGEYSKEEGLCSKPGMRWFLITENIKGGTLEDMINNAKLTLKELYYIILQVLLSLEIALEDVGFTHYDLHMSNILIRELPNITNIRYIYRDKEYYIQTKYVPVIIDYGSSRISFKGMTIADKAVINPQYSIIDYETRPGVDLYKLFFTILTSIKDSKYKNINILLYHIRRSFINDHTKYMSDINRKRLMDDNYKGDHNYGYPLSEYNKPDNFVYYPPCEILDILASRRGENYIFGKEPSPEYDIHDCDLSYSEVLDRLFNVS